MHDRSQPRPISCACRRNRRISHPPQRHDRRGSFARTLFQKWGTGGVRNQHPILPMDRVAHRVEPRRPNGRINGVQSPAHETGILRYAEASHAGDSCRRTLPTGHFRQPRPRADIALDARRRLRLLVALCRPLVGNQRIARGDSRIQRARSGVLLNAVPRLLRECEMKAPPDVGGEGLQR